MNGVIGRDIWEKKMGLKKGFSGKKKTKFLFEMEVKVL
jgi:hypothetical protein